MDKLTAIKIKYNDGTCSDEIPISVLAENVKWNNNNNLNLIEVLGNIKVTTAGTVQNQIDALANEKADVSDVTSLGTRMTNVETDVAVINTQVGAQQKIAEKINDWFEDNPDRIPGGKVVTVSSSGAYRTVDDTYANILSAIASGRTVVVTDGSTTPYPYVGMMSKDGVPVLAFGVSATYNQTAVLSGYLIFDFDSNTRAIYVNQMTELYSKSEIDSMIGDIETLLASI